jgi:hypothetical protein
MILVRNVFQLKWGKADEALALMGQFRATSESQGMKGLRLLTDLGGPMFTLVQEMEVESLNEWEQSRGAMFANPEWQAIFARLSELIESGRTEFYNIHVDQR